MALAPRVLALVLLVAAVTACSGDEAPAPSPTAAGPTSIIPDDPTPTRSPFEPDPTWTPFPPGGLVPYHPGEPLHEFASYLYDTADGAYYRILGRGGGEWSPDSRALVTSVSCAGDGFVEVLDIPSNQSVRVDICSATHLSWSPDGSRLGFVVIQPPEDAGVYVMDRDGTNVHRLVAREGVGDIRWLGEAAIAYETGEGLFPPEIDAYYRVEIGSETVTELAFQNPPTADDPRIIFGDRSASGTWVAFEDGDATYLWSAGTGVKMQLGEGQTIVEWAPQDDRAMVASFREDEPWPQWQLLDPVAGTMTDLPGVGIGAQWMADGVRIAHEGYQCYVDGPRTFDVTVFDTRDGSSRVLTSTPDLREWHFRVSPAAPLAAFENIDFDGDTRYLYLVDLDSGELELLIEAPDAGEDLSPAEWSPDGRYLRFFYGGGGEGC
jgi:hypothetical protein